MVTYIKNIKGLRKFLGFKKGKFESGEDIGYGERAIIFKDITDDCDGAEEDEMFEDFCGDAPTGTFFRHSSGINVCKVMNPNGDTENIYEDEDGNIRQF